MTPFFAGMLLVAFGLSLILITLALWLLRGTSPAQDRTNTYAKFFLIALRLAIGWHCFVEGMEKVSTPGWSSEAYLRESMGPLSGVYRWVAGDRLVAKVTLGPDESFPRELDREWTDHFNAFAAHHDLDSEQLKRAQMILDQRKSDTLTYLRSKSETVTKTSPYPPDLKLEMNMKQRLEEHARLLARVRAAEAMFPSTDKHVHAEWKTAKADLAKWRAELKRSIDAQTDKLKKIDETMRDKVKKSIEALTAKANKTEDEAEKSKLKKEIDEESTKLWEPLGDALTSEQRLQPPMPEPRVKPFASWRLLEWSDFAVEWGLVVLGSCLMLGFLSRTASLATAFLILSFYLAMPALPGWPDPPRLEGHYVLVNKTLIEVLALLALACIPTGRWAGIDGLMQLVCCGDDTKNTTV